MITLDLTGIVTTGTGTVLTLPFGGAVGPGNGGRLSLSSSLGATGVVDDQGNVWTKVKEVNFAGVVFAAEWFCADCSGATSVAVSFAAAATATGQAASVAGALALDATNGAALNSSSQHPGAINTAGADRIVFAMTHTANGPTAPAAFTTLFANGSINFAYVVLTAAQTGFNPAFTVGTSSPFACVQAAYSSTVTTGPATVHLSDLVVWSQFFEGDKQDVLNWHDAFTFAPPVPADGTTGDTFTMTDLFATEENVTDAVTWLSSTFSVVESFGRVADGLTWTETFGFDIGLLAAARFRR